MIRAMWSAAQGMKVQTARVDAVSHNLANLNTPGYKSLQVQAADLTYQSFPGEARAPRGIWPQDLVQLGAGARAVAYRRDLAEGRLMQTERPLDVAIQGGAYFRLLGSDGEEYYTRDGSFHLDGQGRLVNSDGLFILGEEGEIIALPEAAGIEITSDGQILAMSQGVSEPVDALGLAWFANPEGLANVGDNLLQATEESGAPAGSPPAGVSPIVRQGYLEASNADLAREMVSAIMARRAYEFSARSLRTLDEMWGLANEIRG